MRVTRFGAIADLRMKAVGISHVDQATNVTKISEGTCFYSL